jgi:uncharacterized protein (UPF0216 family)
MQDDTERLSKAFWDVELKSLNDGLPKARKSLSELLNEDRPSYRNVKDEEIFLDKKELQELAKLVPQGKLPDVSLPIVVLKEGGSSKGAFQIQGSELDVKIVNNALKKPSDDRTFYKPEILELVKQFPSLIVFGYRF